MSDEIVIRLTDREAASLVATVETMHRRVWLDADGEQMRGSVLRQFGKALGVTDMDAVVAALPDRRLRGSDRG